MAFNRSQFISDAIESGQFSLSEIDSELKRRGEAPLPAWIKVSESLPTGMGLTGTVSGLPYSGAHVAGTVSYPTGYVTRDLLRNLYGVHVPREQAFGEFGQNVKRGLLTGAGLQTIFNLLTPKKTVGRMREKSLGDKSVPTSEMEENVWKNIESGSRMNPELRAESYKRGENLLREIAPLNTTGSGASTTIQQPQNVRINDIYKALTDFSQQNKAYESGSLQGQAATNVDRATRSYLNQSGQLPISTQGLNKVYGLLAGLDRPLGMAKDSLIRSLPWLLGGGSIIYGLRNKIKEAFE